MPWNGSGQFNRTDGTRSGATTWNQAEGAAVDILSTDHDTHDEDIATGLENCLTVDAQTVMNNNTFIKARNAGDTADVNIIKVNASNVVELNPNIKFGGASNTQTTATSDGSDNAFIQISGGGTVDTSRGAYIEISGNEASNAGRLLLRSGDTGNIVLQPPSSRTIEFYSNGTLIWTLDASGDLSQNATNGGDIVFTKDDTGVIGTAGSITAAGSTQGTATAITKTVINIGGGSGGVRLPDTSAGRVIYLWNTGVASLNVYPASGETIGNLALNAPLVVNQGEGAVFYAYGGTAWGYTLGDNS